jgi:hypothetical protein
MVNEMIDLHELKKEGEDILVSKIINSFDEILDRAIAAESKLEEMANILGGDE